ncbi:L-fucose:H+ symporter permease [Fodinibius sediminis]|uniref:MFS transporter, FHS family, L-fucose permease n=1 Tax=Fodinibius sediminis TaxID=1214077 RepID=A0A521C4Q4_9BACT|nr:L-fucose:H+ symporter permease [Fodinibius sediminis]SMO54388.1 MFS transporter, FHS family, L-fucose permease [Fodinibius sediminis]
MSENKSTRGGSAESDGIRAPLLPFILITSLFFMWGLANNLTDTLLAAFKRIMSMSDFQTSWIQIAFYGAYFCLALPAAVFIKRFTYKSGVLLGLGMYVVGAMMFYPSSITMQYGFFLGSLYVLAGGLAVLETSCNPYIIAMGEEASGTRRLNLAQSFNPIGSISGVVISKFYILSQLNVTGAEERAAMSASELQAIQKAELDAVMGPYVALGFVLLTIWITIAAVPMPRASTESATVDLRATIKRLLKKKNYVGGVVAQFFYVGAQICVWSFTIRYVMEELDLTESGASNYYIAALIVFTLFRFINTYLMKYIRPTNLLMGSALLGSLCTFVVIAGSGYVGVIALVAISGFMSLMFPTIFGLASEGLGEDTKIGSSGLIMAIGGGALLPALQGVLSDATGSIHISFWIPLLCFLVVAFYGFISRQYSLTPAKVQGK